MELRDQEGVKRLYTRAIQNLKKEMLTFSTQSLGSVRWKQVLARASALWLVCLGTCNE